jgi:hypothetical protein
VKKKICFEFINKKTKKKGKKVKKNEENQSHIIGRFNPWVLHHR